MKENGAHPAIAAYRAAHDIMELTNQTGPGDAVIAAKKAAEEVKAMANRGPAYEAKTYEGCPCKYYLEHGTITKEQLAPCVKKHNCNPEDLDMRPLPVPKGMTEAEEGSDSGSGSGSGSGSDSGSGSGSDSGSGSGSGSDSVWAASASSVCAMSASA